MGYVAVETSLLDLVQSFDGGTVFDDTNAKRNDWTVLDAQGKDVAAHIEQGADSIEGQRITVPDMGEWGEYGSWVEKHTITLTLAVKRATGLGGDAASVNQLLQLTDDVCAYLRQYPRFNDCADVRAAWISKSSPPGELLRLPEGVGTHVAQVITFTAIQEYTLTTQEDMQ